MSIIPLQLDYDRAVRGYIKLATGLNYVIKANSNAPAPTDSYATALLIGESKDGFNSNTKTYDNENDIIINKSQSNSILNYSIQIYRSKNAMQDIRELSFFHGTPNGRHYLLLNNLVIIDISVIKEISAVIDGEFERRATIDISFGLVSSCLQDIGVIKSIDVEIKKLNV